MIEAMLSDEAEWERWALDSATKSFKRHLQDALHCAFGAGGLTASLQEAYRNLSSLSLVVNVPGAGERMTAAGGGVIASEVDVGGEAPLHVMTEWNEESLFIEWVAPKGCPETVLLFIEDPEAQTPLYLVVLDCKRSKRRSVSLSIKELGFVPTETPWRLRVAG